MVILTYPMISVFENYHFDSNFIFLSKVMNNMAKRHPDVYFVLMVPDNFENNGLFTECPQITFEPTRLPRKKKYYVMHYDNNYIRALVEKYGFDMVYLQQPETAIFLNNINVGYGHEQRIPIVTQHHYPLHHTLPYPVDRAYLSERILQGTSFIVSDYNVFNSLYTQRMMHDIHNDYFRHGLHKSQDTVLQFFFDDFDHILRQYKRWKDRIKAVEKPMVLYNHRLQSYKNYHTTFGMFHDLSKSYDFEIILTGHEEMKTYKGKNLTCKVGMPYEEYELYLFLCTLNTTNTQHESWCIAINEHIAHGGYVIVPDAMTFPEMVNSEYFGHLYSDVEDQRRCMENALSDWKHMHNLKIDRIKERRKTVGDMGTYIDNLYGIFSNVYGRTLMETPPPPDSIKRIFVELLKQNKLDVNRKALTKYKILNSRFGVQAINSTKWKHYLNRLGYEDVIEDGKQYAFKRGHEPIDDGKSNERG